MRIRFAEQRNHYFASFESRFAPRSYRALPGTAFRKSAEIPGRAPAAQQLKKLISLTSRPHRTRRRASRRARERAPEAKRSEGHFSSLRGSGYNPSAPAEAVTRVFLTPPRLPRLVIRDSLVSSTLVAVWQPD